MAFVGPVLIWMVCVPLLDGFLKKAALREGGVSLA
jgi:hypothetical protein